MGLDANGALSFLAGLTRGGVAYHSQQRQQDEQDAERERQGVEATIDAALSSPNLRPEAIPHLIAMGMSVHGAKPPDVKTVRRGLMNLVSGGVDTTQTISDPGTPVTPDSSGPQVLDPGTMPTMTYTARRPLFLSPEEKGQADLAAKRPLIDYETQKKLEVQKPKLDAAEFARGRQALFSWMRNKKGQKLDPDDPNDAIFLNAAERFGMPISVDEWNNAKDNLVTLTLTDPDDPTKTIAYNYNKLTGDKTPIGQKGFQATRDATGMTTAESKAAADREAGQAETKRHHVVTEAQGEARIGLQRQGFNLRASVQDQRTTERGRKELAEAYKLAAQSEMYARSAQDLSNKTTFKDPDTGEIKESKRWAAKRDEYLSKAAALRSQFVNTYGYLFAPSDDAAPQMTLDNFRGLFPNAAGSPAVEASRLGITLTDTDQGVRAPASPMPRRGAPARGRGASQPSAGEDPMIRSYANDHFAGDYGAALRAIQEQRARKGH